MSALRGAYTAAEKRALPSTLISRQIEMAEGPAQDRGASWRIGSPAKTKLPQRTTRAPRRHANPGPFDRPDQTRRGLGGARRFWLRGGGALFSTRRLTKSCRPNAAPTSSTAGCPRGDRALRRALDKRAPPEKRAPHDGRVVLLAKDSPRTNRSVARVARSRSITDDPKRDTRCYRRVLGRSATGSRRSARAGSLSPSANRPAGRVPRVRISSTIRGRRSRFFPSAAGAARPALAKLYEGLVFVFVVPATWEKRRQMKMCGGSTFGGPTARARYALLLEITRRIYTNKLQDFRNARRKTYIAAPR